MKRSLDLVCCWCCCFFYDDNGGTQKNENKSAVTGRQYILRATENTKSNERAFFAFFKENPDFLEKNSAQSQRYFWKRACNLPPPLPLLSPQVVLLIYTCLNLSSAIQHEFFLFSICKNVFLNISQYEYSYYRRLNRGKFLPLLETAPYLQRAVLLHIKNFVPSMIARILESLTSLMIAIGILGE